MSFTGSYKLHFQGTGCFPSFPARAGAEAGATHAKAGLMAGPPPPPSPPQRPDLGAGAEGQGRAGPGQVGSGRVGPLRAPRKEPPQPLVTGAPRPGETFSGDTSPQLMVAMATARRGPAGNAHRSGGFPRRGGPRAERGGAAAAPAASARPPRPPRTSRGCCPSAAAMEGFVDLTDRSKGRDQLFR